MLDAERDALVARVGLLGAEREALVARVVALERERDAARGQQLEAAAALEALRSRLAARPAEPPRMRLAVALAARGLAQDEQTVALALLAASESGPRLLATLESSDVTGLESALERRLALVCGSPLCEAPIGAAVLQVEPARCEVCGGSDIQRAAHGFAQACATAGISRVRFVGGSPNYRTQLEALFPRSGPLTVKITAGGQRVPLSKAKAQQRSDDLVIIWGATELDHATSGAYRSQQGRVETIAHRGIGRMLQLAAERIRGSA